MVYVSVPHAKIHYVKIQFKYVDNVIYQCQQLI